MSISESFWNASIEELKQGYIKEDRHYICLLCGKTTEKGIVYQSEDVFYEAERYMSFHIESEHESVFDYLIDLDKKLTGLTDHQNRLLRLFYDGKSDAQVQKEMGIGSASTIRNHRFVLKEKERQAKLFLTMMELLKEKDNHKPAFIDVHTTARMVDDRYNVTKEENEEILQKFFPEGMDGQLRSFPTKEKQRLVVLRAITNRFESEKVYGEKEVNQLLNAVYDDYALVRRYLIEYGFLDREADGSQYWLKKTIGGKEKMDRKKELKQQYKEITIEAGVFQIKNTKNDKIFIGSTRNLKTLNGTKFSLENDSFSNKMLQAEWSQFGKEAFDIEVLEILKKQDNPYYNEKEELEKLEEKWLNQLQPYGERGYHQEKTR
ncbi:DUF2087 domain-containing protein [Cytobacillus sp. FJAT-53684]|uniref:DUF2087 domain-containing protein n=1 Tax=Cytobacillus mangrovibacter TaxID=3299024 RepID=A0ABW6K2D2_9BACI